MEYLAGVLVAAQSTVISFVNHLPEQRSFRNNLNSVKLLNLVIDLWDANLCFFEVDPQEEIEMLKLLNVISDCVFGHVSVIVASLLVVMLLLNWELISKQNSACSQQSRSESSD